MGVELGFWLHLSMGRGGAYSQFNWQQLFLCKFWWFQEPVKDYVCTGSCLIIIVMHGQGCCAQRVLSIFSIKMVNQSFWTYVGKWGSSPRDWQWKIFEKFVIFIRIKYLGPSYKGHYGRLLISLSRFESWWSRQKFFEIFYTKGEMAEWSIAAVLKTVEPKGSGGSNLSLSAYVL